MPRLIRVARYREMRRVNAAAGKDAPYGAAFNTTRQLALSIVRRDAPKLWDALLKRPAGKEDEMYARIEQHALQLPPSRTDQTWTPPKK